MTVPGETNSIVDVGGVLVGHDHRLDPPFLTGCTVLRFPDGAVAGVDARGGAPGTRETDLLDPRNLVDRVHAIVLTGGSAYGLDVCGGVMQLLEQEHTGFRVGADPAEVVPIVPAAVVFDLGRGGDFGARPDASFGRRAAAAASSAPFAQGNAGAGAGAAAGTMKGGVGSASEVLACGVTVAALVVVNAGGSVVDPLRGTLYGIEHGLDAEFAGLREPDAADVAGAVEPAEQAGRLLANTTIGVVATDALLTKVECQKMAGVAHDGLARAVRPAHTYYDGDTIFAAATCRTDLPGSDPGDPAGVARSERARLLGIVFEAGARAFARAVAHAVLEAESVPGLQSYRDRYPSAVTRGPR